MKKFILGFITAAMFFGAIGTYAATTSKIDVVWNVKAIKFDGVIKNSPNKPFVYNGATYVPLRFVAENLNKEVTWDKASQSVLVNTPKPKVAYLGETVKYMNYQEEFWYNGALIVYNGKVNLPDSNGTYLSAKDNTGTVYKHFIKMVIDDGASDQSSNILEFPLNLQYKTFTASVGIEDTLKDSANSSTVEILVDGKIIKTLEFSPGDFPENISLDVEKGKKLSIQLIKNGSVSNDTGVIFGNPLLK